MTDLDKIISLSKRRGFIYPSSEIYGGLGGVYDFGPYGVELANNIKRLWWKEMVQSHENIVGLDSAIFMSPKVWQASGHVESFSDPLMECKTCNARLRADHILESLGEKADEKMSDIQINTLLKKHEGKIKCPNCGGSEFTEARSFNLLVQSNLGNFAGNWADEPTYLRAETAQGIYINFKNVLDTVRVKVPFGIAQIGKAFRNEISPRQFIFRKREFEQMEMQYFIRPEESKKEYEDWRGRRWRFYTEVLGFKEKNLAWHEHENLVFYASAAHDIEYNFPKLGFKEMEGVHARGDYDLSVHSKASGKELIYTDPQTGEKHIPHVVESSAGLDRVFFAALSEFYAEDELGGERRTVLRFPFGIAPIKVAVFPLLKNKPELVDKARELFDELKIDFMAEFDDSGNIGKRYRRQDEIGTPYCVTVDFDTLEDNTVTFRDRDTGEQRRVKIENLKEEIK
jgi:glycyl-tRNA synthetase